MENTFKSNARNSKPAVRPACRSEIQERLLAAAAADPKALCDKLLCTETGLSEEQVDVSRDEYGRNRISRGKKDSWAKRIVSAFFDPFTAVLLALAVVSTFTDILLVPAGERNPATVIIIAVMVLFSGCLRLIQETRSGNAAARLSEMIVTTACVERQESGRQELPLDEIVVGDRVHLSAGDLVPADIRILYAKDLFVNQAALTGESEPVEKLAAPCADSKEPTEAACLAFLGTTVISGSADAVVVSVGGDTIFGELASHMSEKHPKTAFEKGVNSVSWVLIRFMLVMVPIVFFLNGFTKGNWMSAALFAISVAVGLTPEMLPMIVTTCLAKGAMTMSEQKVIMKNLNSIQNLGSMDVLCTDKTGTLTQDEVILEYHMDVNGNTDDRVLRHAFLNSYYQTGLKNLLDLAIIRYTRELAQTDPSVGDIEHRYRKVDEIPFDFERRRMSVVVTDDTGKTQMITKGAVEEMLRISSFVELDGKAEPLTDDIKKLVLGKVEELNALGMRIIGVAQKTNPSPVGAFSVADEADMVLIGYLAFLDPPKATAGDAIRALLENGVRVKVLTGDNERVTACICHRVGLAADRILLGSDLEDMSDEALAKACEEVTVFAKLSPAEKARVVTALRANGHTVGYMGDGINDAAAMRSSDAGISVDTAVDVAKESADVILLEKDLLVLEKGILEGRRTYANMVKYIKMTSSSNFGNMLSVLVASVFLPFLPMASLHLLLLNLIYDFSCSAIPWDNVDAEYLQKPRKWDAGSIGRFMVWIVPTSSVFDIATYLLLYFALCPAVCGGPYRSLDAAGQLLFVSVFQTGWFVESMWTQSLVIHMIRTPKIPFVQSRASWTLTCFSCAGIAALTVIPYTAFGRLIGLHPLPLVYFAGLIAVVLGYICLATVMKKVYIRRYGELL